MSPVQTEQEVFDAIIRVKAKGHAFCTNFYVTQERLAGWIAHKQLKASCRGDSAFFFRQDRDFWHLYFCAPNGDALRSGMRELEELKSKRVVTDLLGNAETLDALLPAMEDAGLRPYKRLVRLMRTAREANTSAPSSDGVAFADSRDAEAILCLIEETFDRFAKQIPTPKEIEEAICARKILTLRNGETLMGLLHYETRGATSTLRYWVVAPAFQDRRVGASLMRHYLQTQDAVRRFVLWVNSDNENAIAKYRHYHYARDGVVDYVLANESITQ